MAKEPKPTKTATPADPASMGRIRQIIETYRMTRKADPRIGLWLLGAFVVFGAIGFGLFWLIPPQDGIFNIILSVLGALMFGFLGMMVIFSRRAQRAAFAQLEGQLGAAARALTLLRRGWKTDELIGFTKQQDMIHRVVGPPGVVLVGEGNPHRLKQLMASERRKHEKVAVDTPIHEIYVGREEGQVPLPQLARHLQKMKRQLKPAEMTDVLNRIKALDAQRPKVPLPRGPMPTSMKGMRSQMRGR